jgi:hypothetical protein
MQTGTSSRWTNDSRTTFNVYAHLHTGLACFIGIALRRHFSPRPVAGESVCSWSTTAFEAGLPVILSIKRMVEIN